MSTPESVQEWSRCSRWLLAIVGLCLFLSRATAEAPKGEMSAAERQAQLKERNRLWAETHELHSAGKLTEALVAAEKVLAIQRQLFGAGVGLVKPLQWLAQLHEQREDFTAAAKALRQVQDIQTARYGKDDWRVADARLALADLEFRAKLDREQQKQLTEAERLYHQMMAFYRQGKSREAIPPAKRIVTLRKQLLGEKHPDYATSLNNLAGLYRAMGDYAKAEPLYRQALDITRQFLQQTASVQSERQQLRMGDSLRHRLDSYLCAIVQAQAKTKLSGDSTLAALYERVLAWKGAVFMQQRRQRLARSHPELSSLFNKLQDVSRRLATRALAVPAPQQRDAWQKNIADLTKDREDLESELASHCADFDRDRKLARLTTKELQAVLPADAGLLDFLEFWYSQADPKKPGKRLWERHLAVFVVRRGRPLVLKDLGPVKDIAEAIASWRRVIARKGDGRGGDAPSGTLRRLLWQPLAEAVGDAAVVLVSPDGVLGTFPFAALPGDKDDHYLIEERSAAVIAVPQLLSELLRAEDKDHKDAPPSLLLVGDVDFDAGTGKPMLADAGRSAARGQRQEVVGQFHYLKATRGEILAVRDSFETRFDDAKVTLLRGAAATEASLRQWRPRYRYLHLATHGFFAPPELKSALAPPDPKKMALMKSSADDALGRLGVSGYHPGLLSGLALAGANREPKAGEDDGILTALEVAALDLTNVESVVLSACETGLGQVAGGEGLLGLQRAIQVSGARTVVASLWTVDDEWTRKLMERYYENLWQKKMPKLKALPEAQRWVMREGPKRGLDLAETAAPKRVAPPYYWAAFVLSGDWR